VVGSTSTGSGVRGLAVDPAGVAIQAGHAISTGAALMIEQGALRVANAGIGTSGPAFIHRATTANIGGISTRIDHPLTDGNPKAILMVTQRFETFSNPSEGNPGPYSVYNNNQIGVFYSAGFWYIFNQSNNAIPNGALFNVLVIHP
jgi:hypothetical protein